MNRTRSAVCCNRRTVLSLSCALAFGVWVGAAQGQSITTTGSVNPALGPGSENIPAVGVNVGNTTPGTLEVSGGASLTASSLAIGVQNGAGTATFTGAGSTGTLVGGPGIVRLTVGAEGTGTLNILDGAIVRTNTDAAACGMFCATNIANAAGSTGTLVISGAGSRLETFNQLAFGVAAVDTNIPFGTPGGTSTANVTISAGGVLAHSGTAAGLANRQLGTGALGTETSVVNMTITGVGSQWTNTTGINIGAQATALVNVQDGGLLSAGGLINVGQNAGSNGTLTVGGNGASITTTGGMTVGLSGTGTVNVNTGSSVTQLGANNNTLLIGRNPGATGTVNVNGGTMTVQRANNNPFVNIGFQGTGALNVTNGGQFIMGDANSGVGISNGSTMQIGGDANTFNSGQGTLTISGTGSLVELRGENTVLNVGRIGASSTGVVNVLAGGVFNAGSAMNIGRGRTDANDALVPGFGATGTVLVDGVGSQLNVTGVRNAFAGTPNGAPAINVGRDDGTGTLTVRNGGAVLVDGVGRNAATGTTVSVARDAQGTGTLNVQSGGSLTVRGDTASTGISVGRLGNGQLNVTGGGTITVNNTGTLGGGISFGGSSALTTGGNFSGLISGAGSSVTITGIDMNLAVGRNQGSTGSVTVNSGATLNPGRGIIVGSEVGSQGNLSVGGVGTTINITHQAADQFGATFTVGRGGIGTATVSSGAVVNINGAAGTQTSGVRVGGSDTQAGGIGTLNVTGTGSKIIVAAQNETFTVGRDITNGATPSVGTVNITSGGQILHGPNAKGSIGYTPGSTGTVTVLGAGSRLEVGSFLGIGRDINDNPGGVGTLNVTNGGLVKATTIHNGVTGTITGSGTIEGTIINDGVINPGNSPGTLTITNGTLIQGPTGKVILEVEDVGGVISHDKLVFDPLVVPQLDKIEFVFLGNTNPVQVANQGVLDIDNFLLANVGGNNVPLSQALQSDPALLAQYQQEVQTTQFSGSTGDGSQIVSLGSYDPFAGTVGQVTVTPVPEPHEYALMLLGLGLVGWRVRRAQRVRVAFA